MRRVPRTPWPLLLVLVSPAVLAQELELDLSGDTGPSAPKELRPSLAVLEVVAGDAEPVTASRAKQLETELLAALVKSEKWLTVVAPTDAKAKLGAQTAACNDFACFQAVAAKLGVHRAVRLTVQKQGVGSLVSLVGFDPAFPELWRTSLDSEEKAEKAFFGMAGKTQAQKDREFLKKMVPMVKDALNKLNTANGKLIVELGDPGVPVLFDGAPFGTGRTEAVVQRGLHAVTIDGNIYEPFAKDVSIEPLKTVTVDVKLVAKPVAVVKPKEPPGVPIVKRPGLYLALAGAVAAGVGFGLGASSQAVQKRIDQGGVPVGVTRAEAQGAATSAVLANVLVAAGGAMVAGGVTWIILTPTPVDPNAIEPTDVAPVSPAGPAGWTFMMGGSF